MKDTPHSPQSVFSSSYGEAREKFINEANNAGADIKSFEHPSIQCPGSSQVIADALPTNTLNTDALTIDTAWIGSRDAKSVLVMICGTHGPESYTGAALQLDWLRRYDSMPSTTTAMLLIHAANPFGWAYCSRTTENNVDLNRNFIDHQQKPPQTALTQQVQDLLSSSNAKGPRFKKILFGLFKLIIKFGPVKLLNEISQGQYSHPNGIGFGGHSAEWSNQTLRSIFHNQLNGAERVAIIDWHTGIGDYGKPCFLCFDKPDTDEYKRARHMWGAALDDSDANYSSGERPDYQGLLINALSDIARGAGAKTTSCVIEFGTYSNLKMLKALLIDRWLRFSASDAKPETKAALKTKMLSLFYPDDPGWRASVLDHGNDIISQSLVGLYEQEVKQ